MKENQRILMKNLLSYLYNYNPYYNRIMREICVNPMTDDIELVYSALPYSTKEMWLENMDDMLTPNLLNEKYVANQTSGTSGHILKCYKTVKERSNLAVNIWKRRRNIDRFVTPKNYISLFDMNLEDLIGKFYNVSRENIIKVFNMILSLKPRWLSGPISLIEKFAKLIESGFQFDISSIIVIELMGEYVSRQAQDYIEKIFKCKVVNHYGTQETWCIAYGCGYGNHLHIQEEFCYVDYFKSHNEKAMSDEIVITSFNNLLMPIVKYKVGDHGTILDTHNECSCLESELVLSGGRSSDIIYGHNILGNYFFDQIFWKINLEYPDSIFSFSVKQNDINDFKINLIKGKKYNNTVSEIIKQSIRDSIGDNVTVNIEFTSELDMTTHGKTKKFIPYKITT